MTQSPSWFEDLKAMEFYNEMMEAVEGTDDEVAHSREDKLRHRILELIAEGHPKSQQLATDVLKTSELDFCRWCA